MSRFLGALVLIAVSAFLGAQVSQQARAQAGRSPWEQFLNLVSLDDGTGNLIVGDNEFGNPLGDQRTGSHNISFGEANSFSSHGGLVGPDRNTISGAFATVCGGAENLASGDNASVSGGSDNTAFGRSSTVGGGESRSATGLSDWVAGSLLEDD